MRRVFTVFFFLSIFISILLVSCIKDKIEDNSLFNKYYTLLQKNNYAPYDSLLSFYQQLDSISAEYLSPQLQFLKTTAEGRLYFRRGDYERSTRKYREANIYIENFEGSDTLMALNTMSIGLNFMNRALFDSAFLCFEKALDIYQLSENISMMHVVKANMAQAYYNKRDIESSLRIINETLGDNPKQNVIINLQHLKANILGSSGKIDSAMLLDRKMISQFVANEKNYQYSSFYNNLALCFLAKGNVDSALFYCNKSFQADSVAGMEVQMAANLVLMGDIYRNTGDKKNAEAFYQKAINVFTDNNNIDKKYWIYEKLSKLAKDDGDYKLLAQHQDSMLAAYRFMNKLELTRSIELLNIEFETERKNRQIEHQETKIRSQKLILLLIIISALLIFTAVWFYFQNKDKKSRLRIAEKDRKVSEMLIEAEQNERSRIARDLHDGVNQKLAVMKMHLSMLNDSKTEAFENVVQLLEQIIVDVRAISHNLYPKDLEKGIVSALENLCEQNSFVNQAIKFRLQISENIKKATLNKNVQLVIFRIVQEITNNALKYSQASEVNIQLDVINNRIDLRITDNGIGFTIDSPEKSGGIGLNNILNRIKQISGKVDISTGENKGTSYYIEIPA
jgi:signal transduction histidine kinase